MGDNTTALLEQLPNPFTPMAFFPPDLAFQVTVSSYIVVGSCGVFIWDVLNCIKADYMMVSKYRVGMPTLAYFISRLGSLGFVVGTAIFETAAAGDCVALEKGLGWLYTIAVGANTLLFFFRVRAIFDKNIYVVSFFAFMWAAVIAGCITTTQGVIPTNVGPTKHCVGKAVANYVSAAAIIPLVNDTLVFLAISWRLMRNSHIEYTISGGARTMMFGDYMPSFSRALLQDGQAYYLTTVSSSLLTVIMLFLKGIPAVYRTMFTVSNVALMNIMACRVFRNTKFGIFRTTYGKHTNSATMSMPNRPDGPAIPLSLMSKANGPARVSDSNTFDPQKSMYGVEITKTVEHLHDYPKVRDMEHQ